MPVSKAFGKQWIDSFYEQLCKSDAVKRVVDIGVGRGTYSMRLRRFDPAIQWIGIEAWQPYVEQFSLKEKYDQLIIQDVRTIDWKALEKFDVAFLGDILEHMKKTEAINLINTLLQTTRFIIVSLPILYTPQGDSENNPYEIHVEPNWSHEGFLLSFPCIRTWYVKGLNGIYCLSKESENDFITKIIAMIPKNVLDDADIFGIGKISFMKRQLLVWSYLIKKIRPLICPFMQRIFRIKAMISCHFIRNPRNQNK